MNPRFLISLTITVAFSLVILAHTASAKPIPAPVTQTPYLSEGSFFGFGQEQSATQTQSQPQTGMSKAEYRALMLRSEGLNRIYGVGQSSKPIVSEKLGGFELPPPSSTQVASSGEEFDWNDAGIGAAAVFGTVLLSAGLVLTIRRREFPLAH
jgi:hypothetical protein